MSDRPDPPASSPLSRTGPDFLPTAALDTLRQRSALLAEMRRFFQESGYWEVETPLLSHDVVVDAWLEPFIVPPDCDRATSAPPADEPTGELYLQTSPEFAMKRLLAAGAEAIYQITKAFRAGEIGRLHNPEFTIVEWYRAGDTHLDQMAFVESLVARIFGKAVESGATAASVGVQPFPRLTYDEAFEKHVGVRVLSLSPAQLAALAREQRVDHPDSLRADDRDGWLNLLLAERVEPHLGQDVPTFLYDYPASQAALASIRPDHPPVAERFELYIGGIEVCNGYHELTDPAELRRRMHVQSKIRASAGRRALPQQNRLLDAMEAGLPPCSGVALGFDRLLMLALGAESVAEVLAFPIDRA